MPDLIRYVREVHHDDKNLVHYEKFVDKLKACGFDYVFDGRPRDISIRNARNPQISIEIELSSGRMYIQIGEQRVDGVANAKDPSGMICYMHQLLGILILDSTKWPYEKKIKKIQKAFKLAAEA